MKGLLFGGCSFTWGQGLYFYSDLPRQKYPLDEYSYKREELTDAHLRFKDTLRFPRLVANHFNTFESFKIVNGGSEDETFNFFENIFNDLEKNNVQDFISYERYQYEDFDYVIIQLSQVSRNKFHFTLDGVHQFCGAWVGPTQPRSKNISGDTEIKFGYNIDNLLIWMEQNNMSIDEWFELHKDMQVKRLKEKLLFYEDKGIKPIIFTWTDELLGRIKKDEYLYSKFINLSYNNETYETIEDLLQSNSNLKIQGDYDYFKNGPPTDHHPSKKCHEIIAQNIIKRIEKDIL
jgi:hypothetical protein